jgi:hypothetical protein
MFLTDCKHYKEVFYEFQYTCNGHTQKVYCQNEKHFLGMLSFWQRQGALMKKYSYSYIDAIEMKPPLRISDILAIKSQHVRMLLSCSYTGVWYIQ